MRSMLSLVRTGVNRFAAPRFLAASGCLATAVVLAATSTLAQPTGIPRTAWDTPDLSGYWEYRTTTPLQRPEEFADKARLTSEEIAAYLPGRLEAYLGGRGAARR